MITEFRGKYAKFSNFYDCPVEWEGRHYPTTEHAFAAAKTTDLIEEEAIRTAPTPGEAKKLGRLVVHKRTDWGKIKPVIMLGLLRIKFSKEPFKSLLLSTGDEEICEGNWWHDNYWGNCTCDGCSHIDGHNTLGKTLMLIRKELQLTSWMKSLS